VPVVCTSCGTVTAVEPAELAPLARHLLDRYGLELDLHHLALDARCAGCRDAG
jgi:Fur family ferric uptake transcriptional regulator